MATNGLINKADKTGIITIDLVDFVPEERSVVIDLKDFLYQGLIIKEKEFKLALNQVNWEDYNNKSVALTCSVDAIIPPWCYMLMTCKLEPFAKRIAFMPGDALTIQMWKEEIEATDFNHLSDKKVVVRAMVDIPPEIYMVISEKLKPVVKTLMYGEVGLPKVIWKN